MSPSGAGFASMQEGIRVNDFNHISDQARERLIAELHRTVSTVSSAVDDAAARVLDAAEADAKREAEVAAQVERLSEEGLRPLRALSGELLDRAAELDREIARLAALAAEAAETLRARARAPEPMDWSEEPEPMFSSPRGPEPLSFERPSSEPLYSEPAVDWSRGGDPLFSAPPESEQSVPPAEAEASPAPDSEPIELPPILPSLFLESPLDQLDEQRRAVAEAPIEFPPRRHRRFDEPIDREVEIPSGVRMVVEQLRLTGEPESVIAVKLEQMGVDDPQAVLAQVVEH